MKSLHIKIPIESQDNFSELKTTYKNKGIHYYVAIVRAKAFVANERASLDEWKEVNPRDVKESSYVWKSMQQSLEFDAENFIYKNKGILILANEFSYDESNKSIDISLTDKLLHGIVDGGHTFAVLKENESNRSLLDEVFVKVEFIVGIDDRNVVAELTEARNTAAQVKEESIMNLKDLFDGIKRSVECELNYGDKIAYKEYEKGKNISVKEILGYLITFDVDKFNIENPPTFAYSSKSRVLKYFELPEVRNRLNKQIVPLLPTILELWDTLYESIPSLYEGRILTLKKSGSETPIVKDYSKKNIKVHLNFKDRDIDYKCPDGWIFPLFASFRELIIVNNGIAHFKVDPIEFFHKHKGEIASSFTKMLKENVDPQVTGKNAIFWMNFSYKIRELSREDGIL